MFYFEIIFFQKAIFVWSLNIFFILYFWKCLVTFYCNLILQNAESTCFFSALGLERETNKISENKIAWTYSFQKMVRTLTFRGHKIYKNNLYFKILCLVQKLALYALVWSSLGHETPRKVYGNLIFSPLFSLYSSTGTINIKLKVQLGLSFQYR